jgi:DNA-directed RNA polymerase specialized sigma24 family protein
MYLNEGTAGYTIVRKFHMRYADVLATTNLIDLNDVIHEIFLSLSKNNFDNVRNLEHYIMRAIKLQCWSLLDKAIKQKAFIANTDSRNVNDGNQNDEEPHFPNSNTNEQLQILEGTELFIHINLFKTRLNLKEVQLLNLLIDETDRSEMAKSMGFNLNTLDTNIRRLRIKLADHLRNLGYYYKDLERFN